MLTGLASTRSARAAVAAVLVAILAALLMSLPPAVFAQAQSTDATLSALTTSPRDILRFDPEDTSYEVGVASTVTEATVAATATDSNADVSFELQDSNDVTDGHQVALSEGRNPVLITVTAEDGSSLHYYSISINRGVTDGYGWSAERDLDGLVLANDFDVTRGITGDDGIFWISTQAASLGLLAYRQDGQRVPSRDFTPHGDNLNHSRLWNDGETIWVSDSDADKLYAYRLSDGARQTSKEFDLHSDNAEATGIWSDGITMWVANYSDAKLYAYALDGGVRQESREFDLASGNLVPRRHLVERPDHLGGRPGH